MSWSASFREPVRKIDAEAAIDRLSTGAQVEGPAIEQCEAAKRAAKELLKTVPGPYVMVSLSGHANGIGWQKKEGWSNDTIYVSVVQVTEGSIGGLHVQTPVVSAADAQVGAGG